MTNILVINAGSSSLKYQLIDIDQEQIIAKGICERIGIAKSVLSYKSASGQSLEKESPMKTHEDAVKLVLEVLTDPETGVIKDMSSIRAVGHRVLHGGEKYSEPVLIDDQVLAAVEECIPLGPLHNPANLMGIRGCMAAMPGVPMVAVFDTAWGQTMPAEAYMYALPYEAYTEYKVRRYGFHGTSHRYVSGQAVKKLVALGMKKEDTRVITCHLGNGSSITAVLNGQSVDTSMGMTPVEGLMMGTRVGDLDAGALLHIMTAESLNLTEINNLINKQSGLLGISGISFDMREIHEAIKNGGDRAKLAYDMFVYRVRKYIGSYTAVMNGLDALIFTGGIGENDFDIRRDVCKGFDFLALKFNEEINLNLKGKQQLLSMPDSKVKVMVIPTNEELVIANETYRLVCGG